MVNIMNVIFKPLYEDAQHPYSCTKCDHGKCKLPLEVNKEYIVVNIEDDKFMLMGWGSMRFNPECFKKFNSP